MKFVGKYMKAPFQRLEKHLSGPLLEGGNDRSFDNLYSGLKLSKTGQTVAWTGLLGYGAYSVADAREQARVSEAEPGVQSLPGTRGDGMGYLTNNGGSEDLVARGDLVFALHNTRYGGQL